MSHREAPSALAPNSDPHLPSTASEAPGNQEELSIDNWTPFAPSDCERKTAKIFTQPARGSSVNWKPVEPRKRDFSPCIVPSWEREVHPDGAVYFYRRWAIDSVTVDSAHFSKSVAVFTNIDLTNERNLNHINYCGGVLIDALTEDNYLEQDDNVELVLSIDLDQPETECKYYFVDQVKQVIFWVDEYDPTEMLGDVQGIDEENYIMCAGGPVLVCTLYLSLTIIQHPSSRQHCEFYPNHLPVDPKLCKCLQDMLLYSMTELMTSTDPLMTFSVDDIGRMLDVVKSIQEKCSEGDEAQSQAISTSRELSKTPFEGKDESGLSPQLVEEQSQGGDDRKLASRGLVAQHSVGEQELEVVSSTKCVQEQSESKDEEDGISIPPELAEQNSRAIADPAGKEGDPLNGDHSVELPPPEVTDQHRDTPQTLVGKESQSVGPQVPANSVQNIIKKPNGYHTCVLARLMRVFTQIKLYNFHGLHGARVKADESAFKDDPMHGTISPLFHVLNLVLFCVPHDQLRQLLKIWVDKTLNKLRWQRFMDSLGTEWRNLTTYSTVMLAVDISFMALPLLNLNETLHIVAFIFITLSTFSSVGSIAMSVLLLRQNQDLSDESVDEAGAFMAKVASKLSDVEWLAIMYSLPRAFIMWGMFYFVMAISFLVFTVLDGAARWFTLAMGTATFIVALSPTWWSGTPTIALPRKLDLRVYKTFMGRLLSRHTAASIPDIEMGQNDS